MVKSGVLFEVRTEFVNIIYRSFGFKGLIPLNFSLREFVKDTIYMHPIPNITEALKIYVTQAISQVDEDMT
jgi:hypothetical protein